MRIVEQPQALIVATLVASALVSMALDGGWRVTVLRRRGRMWTVHACLFLLGAMIRPSALVVASAVPSGWTSIAMDAGLGFLALDLAGYARHALAHRIPILWRLHRVHHGDDELDWSTALRFHPIDAVLDAVTTMLVVKVLSFSALAIAIHAVATTCVGVFSHGATRWPRWVSCLVVTPAMHRAHHARRREEADGNYGVVLSVWDVVFRTRRPDAASPATVGLDGYADRGRPLTEALVGPFRRTR